MKIEKTDVYNMLRALEGARNPKESWDRIDSFYDEKEFHLGENDKKLAQLLIGASVHDKRDTHSKFLREIMVCCDITAPIYWWKEFDTYKCGTTANSTSTMHKLASKPITLDCFEIDDFNNIPYPIDVQRDDLKSPVDDNVIQMVIIPYLEYLRQKFVETKDQTYWKELIRWLPESWLQTRTITFNYQVIRNMYIDRRYHKLTEWRTTFCDWVKSLPYSEELITYGIDD